MTSSFSDLRARRRRLWQVAWLDGQPRRRPPATILEQLDAEVPGEGALLAALRETSGDGLSARRQRA